LLLGAGRVAGIVEPAADGGAWIEHLDGLDDLYVRRGAELGRVDPASLDADPSTWPLDPLTPIARVPALPTGEPVAVDVAALWRSGAVLTSALLVGITDRCTELAVAYAKEREQFDRPIAGFQAIKHILADMLVRTEVARAAVYAAGAHLDAPDLAGIDRAVSVAKAVAGEAAVANGKAATQVFGGMGFTWEVDVHLYLKRAWVLDTHFGPGDEHCDAVAAAVAAGT
jgi:alkylation response protein AidB-like acyl-CoA dehydrogenase